jgi:hypothetical protein
MATRRHRQLPTNTGACKQRQQQNLEATIRQKLIEPLSECGHSVDGNAGINC